MQMVGSFAPSPVQIGLEVWQDRYGSMTSWLIGAFRDRAGLLHEPGVWRSCRQMAT